MKKYTELIEDFDDEPTTPPATISGVTESTDLIKQRADELSAAIAKAETKEELEALYQKFNINNTKKNALRINQLNELLDQVNHEAIERFTRRPGEISNKEVLDYMTAIQNQIERSQKTVDGIKEINAVQVNNTQNNTVNIHVGEDKITSLDKESRDRITDLVAAILKESNKNLVFNMSDDEAITVDEEPQEVEAVETVNPEDDSFTGDE